MPPLEYSVYPFVIACIAVRCCVAACVYVGGALPPLAKNDTHACRRGCVRSCAIDRTQLQRCRCVAIYAMPKGTQQTCKTAEARMQLLPHAWASTAGASEGLNVNDRALARTP